MEGENMEGGTAQIAAKGQTDKRNQEKWVFDLSRP
jgi:hypothetical protein